MARDTYADLERLTEQLADIRSVLMKQSKSTADDAAHYLGPRARHAARQLQHDGREIVDAARRNPGTTGAILGALALGAVAWFVVANRSDAG